MPKQRSKQKVKDEKEWPVVVYLWAFGLRLVGYLVVGEAIFESKPHPIHWLSGLVGGILGIAAWAGSGIAGAVTCSSPANLAREE